MQPPGVLTKRGDVPVQGALRGQFGRRAGHRCPVVADVLQFVHGQQPQHRLDLHGLGIVRRPDERPARAAAPRLDQAQVPEHGQCLAKGHRGYPELAGQLAFRGQPLTIQEQPEGDGLGEPPGHGFGPAARVQRREERASPDGRERGRSQASALLLVCTGNGQITV